MIPYSNEEKEYVEFKAKIAKLGKDFCNEANKLTPTNYARFKRELLTILPAGFIGLMHGLTD